MYTIAQAAQILGVAAVTLRLWERQGKISSSRTIGGQRRYSGEDITAIRNLINQPRLQTPTTPPIPHPKFHLTFPQKRVLFATLVTLIISAASFTLIKASPKGEVLKLLSFFQRPPAASTMNHELTNQLTSQVLASQTALEDLRFTVNIPALFNKDITAPNVIYSLTAGDNITITPGQRPTISATDQTTDLKIFGNVKVGSNTISAGSKTDTLELAAGDNITLSTSDKKVTIAASKTDVTTSGWTDDGTILRLTTAGDIVSIGTATGAAKLAIDSDTSRDLFTASKSGNLVAKLASTGNFTLSGNILPGVTSTYDLGSISSYYNTIYVNNFITGSSGISGYLQRNANALSPTNITDDFLIGGIATSSAKFRVLGSTGAVNAGGLTGVAYNTFALSSDSADEAAITAANDVYIGGDLEVDGTIYGGISGTITPGFTEGSVVFTNSSGALAQDNANFFWDDTANSLKLGGAATVSGSLVLYGTPTISTTAMQSLTLGNTNTGNIVLAPGGITALTAIGNDVTIVDGLTVGGDVAVNGGDITSSATSFNLLQSNVNTLYLGGASTTLSIGASTGTTTINNANTVVSGDLAVNGGDLTTSATTFNFVTGATTLNIGATTGTTTINNDLTIGNATTDAMTFTGRVAADSDLIPIGTSGTNDLGSSTLPWDNLYVTNVFPNGTSGTIGWWQRNAGILSPLNTTDDLTIGAIATASAKFQIFADTGNATTAGNLTFDSAGTIQTTKNQTLTIGGTSTGNINLPGLTASKVVFTDANKNLTSSGTVAAIQGGTGFSSYVAGQLLYADTTTTLAQRTIGSTGQVLIVSGGLPTWGSISGGSGCTDCVLTDPTSTQTILPTGVATTGLRIAQASGGTADVFSVTNFGSTSKYFAIQSDGTATAAGSLTLFTTPTVAATAKQSLTLGDANTGNIQIGSTNTLVTPAFKLTTSPGSGYALISDATGVGSWTDVTTTGNLGPWTLSGSSLFPDSATYNLLIGSATVTDDIGKFTVSGTKTGKALAVFNDTGTDQNLLTASASGVTKFTVDHAGLISTASVDSTSIVNGSVANADLANSSITINSSGILTGGGAVSLGGTLTLTATEADTLATVTGRGATTSTLTTFTGGLTSSGAVTGKALNIFNETGDQNILVASASGTTVMTLGRTGNLSLTVSSSSNADVNLSSTGDFTISDAGTPYATFTDTGVFTLDSLNLDGTTIGLTTDTDLLSLAANALTVNGDLTTTADIAINGGDLTSTATTFNLLNATVTTLNLGGASTTLSIGAGTGTTTVNNALTSTGTLTANGTLTVNSDTVTLGNAITDAMTFTARVAQDADLIPITTTGTNDLGASALPWDNLYVNNVVVPTTGTGQVGYWTRAAGALSPAITNDVLAATTSATVAMTITQTGAFNALLVEDAASDTTPFVIDQSGNVGIGTTAPDAALEINHATGDSLRLTYNDSNGSATNFTDFSLDSTGGLTLTGSAASVASGVSAEKTFLTLTPATITLTGTTQVTSLMDSYLMNRATIAGDTATVTVDDAATLTIGGPPAEGTNVSLTEAYGLKINTAATTATTAYGLYVDAPTGAGSNYGAIFNTGNIGIGTTAPDAKLDSLATTEQLRLTYTDGTVYSSHTVDSAGDLTIDNTGTQTIIADDLAVNGGDITTSQTTATLFNTTATTLSLGGAATTQLNLGNGSGNYTAINLGSGAGTHTINIAGTGATAADTINIGTGGTGADTINLGSSASTTALNFTSGTGAQTFASSMATGNAFAFTANSLSTGLGLYLSSTSTALSSGSLASLDWSPGSATTATGDLLKLNIGANGLIGNIFNVLDNGSSVFSVSQTAITNGLPANFTAAGDVSVAYDLVFTNQTASYIKSNAPLYIVAGEAFENNDLTLQTYGTGAINIPQSVATTGSPTALRVTGGAHTALTASTEAVDVNFNLARTVQFSTGALATQRAALFQAPTYGFVDASTLTDAATVAISGAPVKGTNATITNTHGLLIQAGAVSTAGSAYGLTVNAPTGATNIYAAAFLGGNVGIGTATPLATLHVSDSQTATASAYITNTNTAAGIVGLGIKLSSTTLDTTSRFINFLDKSGIVIGKINAANTTTVAYSANGTDMAEYFIKNNETFSSGDIVSASNNDLTKTSAPYDSKMIGIVSTAPSFVGGEDGINKVLVAIAGQVPVKIATDSAAIAKGDFVTSSITAGRATKATKPGFVIGKALEDWNPVTGEDQILVYVNNTWADPDNSFASDIASISAELAQLKLTSPLTPLLSLGEGAGGEVWSYATASGKLMTTLPVQVPELTVTGKLAVGLLTIDDLEASISSLTGVITVKGDLAVSGSIKVLGTSAGKAIIPAGSLDLSIDNSLASTTSAIFVTPEDPIAISGQSTQSGQFTVRIPQALPVDLKFQWWIVN